MLKPGDKIRYRRNRTDTWKPATLNRIDPYPGSPSKWAFFAVDEANNEVAYPLTYEYIEGQTFQFLDETLEPGVQVSFIPKNIEMLIKEGWSKSEKGTFYKKFSPYRIGKKKMERLGRVVAGLAVFDGKGGLVLTDGTYNFSADVVEYVILNERVQTLSKEIVLNGTKFERQPNGNIKSIGSSEISFQDSMALGRWLMGM